MKPIHYILICCLLVLVGCQDKFDQLERYSELTMIEEDVKKELLCDEAILTIIEDEEGETLQLFLINSKEVTLKKGEDYLRETCYTLSCNIVENILEKPYRYKYVEVIVVEKINFIVQSHETFGKKYLVKSLDEVIKQRK